MPRRRDDRGAHAVEFTIVFLFVVLPVICAIIQYGYQYWALQTADAAAREAVRSMAVGTDWTCTQSDALGKIANPAVGGAAPTVTVTYTDAAGNPTTTPKINDIVSIRVQFDSLRLGFIPIPDSGHIDRTAKGYIQNVPATPLPC